MVSAQQTYSVDTSYTVKSTYNKLIKKYPSITVPVVSKNTNVDQIIDIVYFKSKDRTLHIDAFINKTKKQNPAVVMIHGGGWRSGIKLSDFGRRNSAKEILFTINTDYRSSKSHTEFMM